MRVQQLLLCGTVALVLASGYSWANAAAVVTADVSYLGPNPYGYGSQFSGEIYLDWADEPGASSYNIKWNDPDFGSLSSSTTTSRLTRNGVWGPDGGVNGGFWAALDRAIADTATRLDSLSIQAVFPNGPATPQQETVSTHSRKDLILGKGELTPNVSGNSPSTHIEVDFQPGSGLTLQQAAIALGYDHFNWRQEVVKTPSDWVIEREVAPGVRSAVSTPFVDPSVDGTYWVRDLSANAESPVVVQSLFDDTLLPYYDEVGSPAIGDPQITGTNVLHFEDWPSVPVGFFDPGEYMEFRTELIGVRIDSNGQRSFESTGKVFSWKSNAEHDGAGQVFISTIDDGSLPQLVAGGIFGYSEGSDSVPEPSSLSIFAGMGAIGLLFMRRRHSTSQCCPRSKV